jgi:hypothetical protein
VLHSFSIFQKKKNQTNTTMDMGGSSMGAMPSGVPSLDSMESSGMGMVFFTSTTTPLYGLMWSPTSTGSYAGTCIFLIALSIFFRVLFALRYVVEKRFADRELNRRYIVVHGKPTVAEAVNTNPDAKTAMLITERGAEESVRVVRRNIRAVMPWRLSTDLPRAVFNTLLAGVGYLL